MQANQEISLWGWADFFSEVSRFIDTSQRQMDGASYQYTEFVIERYQMIFQNIGTIREHLERHVLTDDNRVTISPILSNMSLLQASLTNLIIVAALKQWSMPPEHLILLISTESLLRHTKQ